MREVVVVDSIRTGMAKSFRGSFNMTRSDDMLATCIDALLERNQVVEPKMVEDVVVGAANHEGEQGGNLARLAVVLSKLPVSVAGQTINRFCSSGLQAIAIQANQIASGQTDIGIAGGVDSISMTGRQQGVHAERNKFLEEHKPAVFMAMGSTAEVVAKRYNITREEQDKYSLQSQQRYAKAQAAGYINEEIVPMSVNMKKVDKKSGEESIVEVVVGKDECNRPTTSLDGLASLPAVFEEGGSVTAGNSSQLSDGASMTLLMTMDKAKELGLKPLGIYRGFTVAGCEPDEMGIGPVFAVPRLLQNAKIDIDDVDLWELNEAFASQCLYCRDKLGIDNDKYNVNGGSISIGHPFGMTGSRLTGTILRELHRRKKRFGVVTMCIGGGQGAAGLFESIW